MAQLTGEVAYLHQACALCFAMRDNLAAAVVSTLLCEPVLHPREGGSRLNPKGLLVVVQCLLSGWSYSPHVLSIMFAVAKRVPHLQSVLFLGCRMCSQRQSALYYRCN
jgi:hypothetical protein